MRKLSMLLWQCLYKVKKYFKDKDWKSVRRTHSSEGFEKKSSEIFLLIERNLVASSKGSTGDTIYIYIYIY